MKLPDDMFRQEILPYLTVHDIVMLDNACMNHKYRPQLLEKISGVILTGDYYNESMQASLFKWLGRRRIYLINMNLGSEYDDDDDMFTTSGMMGNEDNYVDQFRYTQNVVMRGLISDDTAVFIISHCSCLFSISINDNRACLYPQVTDYTLQSIADHCRTGLQSLSLHRCKKITDAGLITISENCYNLKSLSIYGNLITDASIISISIHCTRIQMLYISSSTITDASIISISEKCIELQRLLVDSINITDASLVAIVKNCTGLKYFNTYRCDGLSCSKLRRSFNSISELRAILLSIYPSLPI